MADNSGAGFYLTLLSNASMSLCESNTQSEFKNILPEPLDLKDHEVALAEFSYTETWSNIKEDFIGLIIQRRDINTKVEYQDSITLEKGYYANNRIFFRYVNEKLKPLKDKYGFDSNTLEYKQIPQKVTIHLPPGVQMAMTSEMSDICGFEKKLLGGFNYFKNETSDTKHFEAEFAADVHLGLYTFYVYCDLVSPQIVGDARVPLLRTVPVKIRTGVEQVTKVFENPHYLPLAKNYVNSIQVYIRDDTGQPISFQRGKTIVKLHIRPRGSAYL